MRNQNLDEAGILRVCELIGNVLKKKNEEIIISPNLVMQGMISHFDH